MKYRREIDGLRAVAVIPVILFHAGLDLFGGGYIGVDVFFVISGYLITSIIIGELESGTFSIANFYERRARRILPALFLVMAICVPFAFLLLLPADRESFFKSLIAVSFFASNIFFWRESGYFDTAAEFKPLLHTWSLAVEEQFYLLFPLFLLLTWRLGKRSVVGLVAFALVASLVLAQWAVTHKPGAAFFLAPTRAWELAVGSLIAFYRSGAHQPEFSRLTENVMSMLGLVLIGFSVFIFSDATPFPGVSALIPTTGTALIILFGWPHTYVGRLLGARLLVGIGLVSYSAYLWHQPIFAFLRHAGLGHHAILSALALSAASILLAYVSWRLVEQPFRKRNLFKKKTIYAISLAGTVAFLATGVFGVVNSNAGFSDLQNMSPYVQCEEQDGLCVFGNEASNDVIVLVGDSHAFHLSRALEDRLGDDYKLILIQCGSCFMGDRVTFDGKAWSRASLNRARGKIRELRSLNIHAVIRAQRWHGYGIESDRELENAIRDAYSFFDLPYKNLIIVGSTATIDRRCHLLKYYGKRAHSDCSEDPISHKSNQKFISVTQQMHVPENVYFAYPYKDICKADKCSVIRGDTALYYDDHHLTRDGAALVMDDIERVVRSE